MSQTVLVIDSNSAVQAITSLALNQTECVVETLADGSKAYQRILATRPVVVLCAKEIAGVDPFELCRRVKADCQGTALVLLAPAEGMKDTAQRAKEIGFDEVIFKPFKSNRLREVVNQLIQRTTLSESHSSGFYISVQDSLRKRMLERFFQKRKLPVSFSDRSAATESFQAAFLEWDPDRPLPAPNAQRLIVLAPTSELSTAEKNRILKAYPGSTLLPLPLSMEKLRAAVHGLIPEETLQIQPDSELKSDSSHPELAARISASIFQRLLLSNGLKERNWEQLSQLARDEVLKIGRSEP